MSGTVILYGDALCDGTMLGSCYAMSGTVLALFGGIMLRSLLCEARYAMPSTDNARGTTRVTWMSLNHVTYGPSGQRGVRNSRYCNSYDGSTPEIRISYSFRECKSYLPTPVGDVIRYLPTPVSGVISISLVHFVFFHDPATP
eukprot:3314264-Rhodomonas_salina.1